MIDIQKDRKGKTWIVTKTDPEGFHHQLNLTTVDMERLVIKWLKIESNLKVNPDYYNNNQ